MGTTQQARPHPDTVAAEKTTQPADMTAPVSSPKRRPGRPTLLDARRFRTIVREFERGASVPVVAKAAGISKRTLFWWLQHDGDVALRPAQTKLRIAVDQARRRADRSARSGVSVVEIGRDPAVAMRITEVLAALEQRAARYRAFIARAMER